MICCICNVNFVFPDLLELGFCIQKNLPFLLFYGAFWSKIGDLNSHPQFGKLMCWPLTLILHIKVGSQALPVPYLPWFFDEMVSPQTLRLFLRRLLRKSYERDYLIFTSIYDEKNVWFALKCKKTPSTFIKKVEGASHGKKIGERRRRSPYKNKSFLISMLLYALFFKKSTDYEKIPQFFGWNHK